MTTGCTPVSETSILRYDGDIFGWNTLGIIWDSKHQMMWFIQEYNGITTYQMKCYDSTMVVLINNTMQISWIYQGSFLGLLPTTPGYIWGGRWPNNHIELICFSKRLTPCTVYHGLEQPRYRIFNKNRNRTGIGWGIRSNRMGALATWNKEV